jgi:hypothetical protein
MTGVNARNVVVRDLADADTIPVLLVIVIEKNTMHEFRVLVQQELRYEYE